MTFKISLTSTTLLTLFAAGALTTAHAQPTTLDPGFADGGELVSPLSASGEPQATYGILELSDGYYLGIGHKQFAGFDFRATLMKYDICGVPDSTFGNNGLSIINDPGGRRLLPTTAQGLTDGKILVAGASNSGGAVSTWRPTLFRLMQDGSLDMSYGTNGIHLIQPGGVSGGNFGNLIKISGDTLIGAIGRFGNINGGTLGVGLMRILPDGTPDQAFGTGGILIYSYPNMGYSFAEWEQVHQANDSTYLLTRAENIGGDFIFRAVVYAYDTSGTVRTDYGLNGRVEHPTILGNIGSRGIRSVLDGEGRLVMVSAQRIFPDGQDVTNLVFTRYLPSGVLDTSFGDLGTSIILSTYGISPRTISIEPDGEIFVSCIQPGPSATVNTSFIKLDGNGILIQGSQTTLSLSNTGITDLIKLDNDRWLAQGYGEWGQTIYQSQLRFSDNPIILPTIELAGSSLTANGSGPEYQWILDGETVSGATDVVHTPVANGSYTVIMTDDLGCTHTSEPFEFTTVSTADQQNTSMHIINNPAFDQLMLRNDLDVVSYEIVNINGQRMAAGQLAHGINVLEVSGFAKGMYLLRTIDDKNAAVQKFVKH